MAQQYDLIIVGAGMVGATLAAALAETSLRIAVLDAVALDQPLSGQPTASGYDPRVSALSAASERIFTQLGVWPLIPAEARCAYRHMHVWDTLRASRVTLLGGRQVEALVREEDGWRLGLVGGERLYAPLIVAADGGKSKLRELAGFTMREWDYLHSAVVTTVQVSQPHQDTAWQRFLPSGPLAFLPLPDVEGRHYCSIVWSLVPDQAQRVMALTDDLFAAEIAEAIEQRMGQVLALDPRHCIALRQRHAKDYVMDGLVLVGDAAHSIHPLAGQGVNLGLLDAAELTDVLKAALGRGVMAAMEGFERLFDADALSLRWLRNAGMQWLDRQGTLKSMIIRRAMGLTGRLPMLARHAEEHVHTE